jgi:SAM-dependent methyltransferase
MRFVEKENLKRSVPTSSAPSPLADFIEWDIRNWSAALDFWLAHTSLDLRECSALELGSRNGGLSLWMALQGARVVCSDVQRPPHTAARLHRSRGVLHLIEYEAIDAIHIPYTSRFDVVLFKSILGAIGRSGDKRLQSQAVREMHRSLKPGGELFFAENLVGCPAHRFFRRKFVEWGTTWRYVSIAEMQEFLSPFSSVHYKTVGFTAAFGRSELQRNALAVLDRAIVDYLVPETWRYIVVGVAKK